MKNLESARVQMVEKIKSISDFIEKEIENENSKKVNKCNFWEIVYDYNQTQAYRRKREVDYSEDSDEESGSGENASSSGEEDDSPEIDKYGKYSTRTVSTRQNALNISLYRRFRQ